jgi:hypothetical protein
MDLNALPIAALPLPAPAGPQPAPTFPSTAAKKSLPLPQRLTLKPTISAKVNYYDLAQTRRAPFDLRSALIWLCLCAHDNRVWWEPRSPDHVAGEDAPPLPLALNFAAWMQYIQDWQCETFAPYEEQEVEALALRVWLGAHETVCVPEEDSKKNGTPARLPTGANSMPMSSAAETPAGATTCSSTCRFAPPTASFTHGSPPAASPVSVPPSPRGVTRK